MGGGTTCFVRSTKAANFWKEPAEAAQPLTLLPAAAPSGFFVCWRVQCCSVSPSPSLFPRCQVSLSVHCLPSSVLSFLSYVHIRKTTTAAQHALVSSRGPPVFRPIVASAELLVCSSEIMNAVNR